MPPLRAPCRAHAARYSRRGSSGSTDSPLGPFTPSGSATFSHDSARSIDRYSAPSSALPISPRSLRRAITRYSAPSFAFASRHANGSCSGSPLFFNDHDAPPSSDRNTPRPYPATYSDPPSSRTWVAAVGGMPFVIGCHVLPPSSLRATPPRKRSGDVRRHILGRGRSCVPLIAAHMRPLTFGSNSTQYVVLTHSRGTPDVVALRQLRPPFSLAHSP